jgi:hypothetical protein
MATIAEKKHGLVQELWVPFAKQAGDSFFPKLRKNKRMRMLTLTDDSNCEEISAMIEASLTTSEAIFGWTSSMFKKARLETHKEPITVIGATRYEDSIASGTVVIMEYFPFDILNMDFTSQNSESYSGRIEKEIISLELTIKTQKDKISDKIGFVLFYTTKLNSFPVKPANIKAGSDRITVPDWSGLNINSLPSEARAHQEKRGVIEVVLLEFSRKYGFSLTLEQRTYEIQRDTEYLLAIVGTFKAVQS